ASRTYSHTDGGKIHPAGVVARSVGRVAGATERHAPDGRRQAKDALRPPARLGTGGVAGIADTARREAADTAQRRVDGVDGVAAGLVAGSVRRVALDARSHAAHGCDGDEILAARARPRRVARVPGTAERDAADAGAQRVPSARPHGEAAHRGPSRVAGVAGATGGEAPGPHAEEARTAGDRTRGVGGVPRSAEGGTADPGAC